MLSSAYKGWPCDLQTVKTWTSMMGSASYGLEFDTNLNVSADSAEHHHFELPQWTQFFQAVVIF